MNNLFAAFRVSICRFIDIYDILLIIKALPQQAIRDMRRNGLNKNFRLSLEIDKALKAGELYNSVMLCENTPELLQQIGLDDLPILIGYKHIRNILHEKDENVHHHGLTKDLLLNFPQAIQAPALIMDSLTRTDSVIIVMSNIDSDKLPLVCSLRPNGTGMYNLHQIASNYLTSVYGKNKFVHWISRSIAENKILYVSKEKCLELEKCSQLQLLKAFPKHLGFNTILHKTHAVFKYPSQKPTPKHAMRSLEEEMRLAREAAAKQKPIPQQSEKHMQTQ